MFDLPSLSFPGQAVVYIRRGLTSPDILARKLNRKEPKLLRHSSDSRPIFSLTSSGPCGEGPQRGGGLDMRLSRHFHHSAAGAHGNHGLSLHGGHARCRHALKQKLAGGLQGSCFHFLHAGSNITSSLLHNNHFCWFFNESCENANDKHMADITMCTTVKHESELFLRSPLALS